MIKGGMSLSPIILQRSWSTLAHMFAPGGLHFDLSSCRLVMAYMSRASVLHIWYRSAKNMQSTPPKRKRRGSPEKTAVTHARARPRLHENCNLLRSRLKTSTDLIIHRGGWGSITPPDGFLGPCRCETNAAAHGRASSSKGLHRLYHPLRRVLVFFWWSFS